MEKLNFVKNGVVRLLPGFRFHPTDQELVLDYLMRKVFSIPLPALIIPEVDQCKSDPWDLPAWKWKGTFSVQGKLNIRIVIDQTGPQLPATGLDKKVVSSRGNQVLGMKKTLVFYRGRSRTDWIMHEYRLAPPQSQSTTMRMQNWVLCRIFLKKRSSAKNDDEGEVTQLRPKSQSQIINIEAPPSLGKKKNRLSSYDLIAKNRTTDLNVALVSSSSGSSGITQPSFSNQLLLFELNLKHPTFFMLFCYYVISTC